MNEPEYFTEKFVEAVQAGCIPVYRASPDIRDSVLKAAVWFDPADPRWPWERAIEAALEADAEQCQSVNEAWLKDNQRLRSNHSLLVFVQIASSLREARV